MRNSGRTFQITLPVFQWRRIYSWKTALAAICFCSVGFGVYWWKMVRPFVFIPGGTLQVAKRDVLSEVDGLVFELLGEDVFQKGQILVSAKDPLLMAEEGLIAREMQTQQREIDSLQAKFDQNMQQYVYLQNELEAEIGPTQLSEQILAEIQQLQTALERAESKMQGLEIAQEDQKRQNQVTFAPFDGLVLNRFKQVGERARKGDSLVQICDQDRRWVEAEIDEALLAKVHVGMPARLEFALFPAQRWQGQVSWISPVVESGKVKIRLTADLLPLRPGLSAKTFLQVY